MNTNRVMIVTGASSGIGRALAERAARAGYDVFAVGRDRARLAALENAVALATGKVSTLALDLRMRGAAQRIARAAAERFGRIDVVVNAAGAVAVGPISQQSDAALREQLQVHVLVPLALVREALAALRASRGHVFFFGSGVARIPVGKLGAYPSAKAAVRSMTRIVRNELRADGIAVTYVDPGAVATEFMTRAGFAGPPPSLAVSPYDVGRRIFAAFETRRPVVNAVPWQTFFVALGEALPAVTDFILQRAPGIIGGESLSSAAAPEALPPAPEEPEPDATPASALEAALEPHAARMKKLNLSVSFVRGILTPERELELGDVAMRWAGMPNKNERALTNDVLDALAAAGYLAHLEPERYRVVRAAED